MNKTFTFWTCLALIVSCSSCYKTQGQMDLIALQDPSPKRRMNAIGLGTPQDVLEKIYKNDDNSQVRSAAVVFMKDKKFLREIALNKTEKGMSRGVALGKLNDPQLAMQLAADKSDQMIREDAVTYMPISEQRLLEEYAENDENYSVRYKAVSRVKNQDILVRILKNEKHRDIRNEAAKSLNKQDYIMELIDFESDNKVRASLVRKLTIIEKLNKLSLNDKYDIIRGISASKITDQKILEKIIATDPESYPREKAIINIKNIKIVENIAAADPQENVRKAAISVLTNKDLLKSIYKNDPELRIRCAADNRLKEISK